MAIVGESSGDRVAVIMMVRDEAGRVGRALSSVRSVANAWLVVDTGSADNTVDEIADITADAISQPEGTEIGRVTTTAP